ncbi:MBL fold metallo-hydrolase [Erythrobacter sp.]|uniref:MBL fold metallo-hydrolase n=1 Tax=Erythrobacter sp. TaxID=1042 RepID=UPI001425DC26|nr:MBL fold metallo-hydrolase [Erythrobacter sp.]QIQ85289.1 MAG: MBL fold metallo-hydrolase [Erythrobacter sp.]
MGCVRGGAAVLAALLALGQPSIAADEPAACARELVVLGTGQDAGAPQIGNGDDHGPPLWPTSLALVDREAGTRYLFDATPAITGQLALLDAVEPPRGEGLGIDGIFLTHAHIGHYLGLAYLGTEAAGARGVPVFAMERMAAFLRDNGPWSQLVKQGNIALTEMAEGAFTVLSDDFGVLPIRVPHRDEYSETVGFIVMTPDRRALYLPDLDSWEEFESASGSSLEQLVAGVDFALIDATFWDDGELEGRDMSAVPHPRVKAVIERLAPLPATERVKVHFIHMNHTNPLRDPASAESRKVEEAGFAVARRGMRMCLSG